MAFLIFWILETIFVLVLDILVGITTRGFQKRIEYLRGIDFKTETYF